jgi:regulatory protein
VPRRSSSHPKAPPTEPAYEVGVRLIARRAHSAAEVRRKLDRRGYRDPDVEEALDRLRGAGYLSDEEFARGYVRRRSRSLGPLAISAELGARGVDREVAASAVARLSPTIQVRAAHRIARRLAGHTRSASYRELLGDVGAKLLRRGFPMDVARQACRAVWEGTPEEAEA